MLKIIASNNKPAEMVTVNQLKYVPNFDQWLEDFDVFF